MPPLPRRCIRCFTALAPEPVVQATSLNQQLLDEERDQLLSEVQNE